MARFTLQQTLSPDPENVRLKGAWVVKLSATSRCRWLAQPLSAASTAQPSPVKTRSSLSLWVHRMSPSPLTPFSIGLCELDSRGRSLGSPALRSRSCRPRPQLTVRMLRPAPARADVADCRRSAPACSVIAPAAEVGSRRRTVGNAAQNERQIHEVVVQPRIGVGKLRIAVPAVFGALAVSHLALVRRPQTLETLLRKVDRIVQIVSIGAADVDVDLAAQLWRERAPIARNDVRQIEMLAPVLGHLAIDDTAQLVVQLLRVAVRADWSKHRAPDVVLSARARAIALRELHIVGVALRGEHFAEVVADRRPLDRDRLTLDGVGIRVLVNVDQRVGAEIDRIGAGGECAVVHVRIEHLGGEGLPAAGRAAIGEA